MSIDSHSRARATFHSPHAGAHVMDNGSADNSGSVREGAAHMPVMGSDDDRSNVRSRRGHAHTHVMGTESKATGRDRSTSRTDEPRAQARHGRQFRPPPEADEREFLRAGLGAELRELRIGLGLSQRALAERAGCAPQTPGRIELGQRRTRRSMLESLARVLCPDDVQALTDRLVELAGESLAPEVGRSVRWRTKRARRALERGLRLDLDPMAPLPSDPTERRAALRREIAYMRTKLAEHRLRSRILTTDKHGLPAASPSTEDMNPTEGEDQ